MGQGHPKVRLLVVYTKKERERFNNVFDCERAVNRKAVTRYSELPPQMAERKARTIARRKYTTEFIVQAIALVDAIEMRPAAKKLKVPFWTLHAWYYQRELPKTGEWSMENVRPLMEHAKKIYTGEIKLKSWLRIDHLNPLFCMMEACRHFGRRYAQLRKYLRHEALPCPPGFPVFADANSQQRAEDCWLGKRISPNPTFGPTAPDAVTLPVADTPALDPGSPLPAGEPPSSSPNVDPRFLLARSKRVLQNDLTAAIARRRVQVQG